MKRWERVIAGSAMVFFSSFALSKPPASEHAVQACIEDAATAFQIPALPVRVLRRVEAGAVGTASPNTDGSVDLGPMQINSSWLPSLRRIGITEDQVRNNPCINAYVGAWIFAQTYAESKGQIALAMARYHSHNAAEQRRYLNLVLRVIDEMTPALAMKDAGR